MRSSVFTKESNNQDLLLDPDELGPMIKKKQRKKSRNMVVPLIGPVDQTTGFWILTVLIVPLLFFSSISYLSSGEDLVTPQNFQSKCIWQICAVDTMKTSRDMARVQLHNPDYDQDIRFQLRKIKETGADYVSIDTPYDEEFLPYLKRWVSLAREEGLKVWFRGNWSRWEGWFGYPKNMTPEEHLEKNREFIITNSELFQSGDIFDPCPECENAQWWPQDSKNSDYQMFIQKQQRHTEAAFGEIDKQVLIYPSIIGGRAKDVLDQTTFNTLGNVISIDHYVKNPEKMTEFVDYFEKLQTKTLVSEFGAPIPDMNGIMNETQQAEFIRSVFESLYQKRDTVVGINYWVLSHGTTALIAENGQNKIAFEVVRQYFSPAVVQGRAINDLGEGLSKITIRSGDGATQVETDSDGYYRLTIPPRKFDLVLDDPSYPLQKATLQASQSGQVITHNFIIQPKEPDVWYQLRKLWHRYFFN